MPYGQCLCRDCDCLSFDPEVPSPRRGGSSLGSSRGCISCLPCCYCGHVGTQHSLVVDRVATADADATAAAAPLSQSPIISAPPPALWSSVPEAGSRRDPRASTTKPPHGSVTKTRTADHEGGGAADSSHNGTSGGGGGCDDEGAETTYIGKRMRDQSGDGGQKGLSPPVIKHRRVEQGANTS
ncbi:hypothetical protein Pelo_12032 [Pelomyxa schiedti]|nr:hypothetical protein Pelo_12032 [Pelomyxa schiedti]